MNPEMFKLSCQLGADPQDLVAMIKAARTRLPEELKVPPEVFEKLIEDDEIRISFDFKINTEIARYYGCRIVIDTKIRPFWDT